jgi:two-component system LytT family response regulator
MNRLSVIVVDDEAPALRRLSKMVEQYPELDLVATARNSVEAVSRIRECLPDILLLDIQLKDATAFDVLHEVQDCFTGKIIFVTAYDKYAVKAFEFEALDYLLKPYTVERFNKAMERVAQKDEASDLKKIMRFLSSVKTRENKSLIIPEGVRNHFVSSNDIQYIYAEGYYANIVMKNEKKLLRISLKKLESLLPDNFLRINKSTIVNRFEIKQLIKNKASTKVIMPDGNEFQISENYRVGIERFIAK